MILPHAMSHSLFIPSCLTLLLDKGGSATMHEISNITMRQHNSTSTLIKRMLKQGLVGKEKMSTGKRYKISITKKGQSIYEKVTRISINMAFSALSPKEKQRLAACLRQLIDKGRDMLGLDQTFPFLPSRLAD
jgi:DNA-binding MarR family transcriptional regulator